MTIAETIVAALESRRFDEATEDRVQRGVEAVLLAGGWAFNREASLSAGDRIDFLVLDDGVGIECKTGGSLADVTRQLHRYAQHPEVKSLILVTTRLRLGGAPGRLNGKPVYVVATMGGVL